MITCRSVLEIAIRLELAYDRKFVGSTRAALLDSELWVQAAVRLIALHEADNCYPKDPELFIAVQKQASFLGENREVVLEKLVSRYTRHVRRLIRTLRDEIDVELKYLSRNLRRGLTLECLVRSHSRTVTPLSRFIFAHMHGRRDLSDSLIAPVLEQHKACPLYRQASVRWLKVENYPSIRSLEHWHSPFVSPEAGWDVSHN